LRTVRFDSHWHCCLMSNAYGILQAFSTTEGVRINLKAKHSIDFKSSPIIKTHQRVFLTPKTLILENKKIPFLISPSYLKTINKKNLVLSLCRSCLYIYTPCHNAKFVSCFPGKANKHGEHSTTLCNTF